jgi:hypothetical protein
MVHYCVCGKTYRVQGLPLTLPAGVSAVPVGPPITFKCSCGQAIGTFAIKPAPELFELSALGIFEPSTSHSVDNF